MTNVAAFYRFAPLEDPAALKAPLQSLCDGAGVKGTILLASEGINGTIAGVPNDVAAVLAHLETLPGCSNLAPRVSETGEMPFGRMRVRLKREIVTMGVPDADPTRAAGHYVDPGAWNELIGEPDVICVDVRNDYEVAIGSFAGAENPETARFGEFPDWWSDNRGRLNGKRFAMFCTGGIRCEKASALLRRDGVDGVYHLKGGILRYLEEIPEERSLWRGDCFVFDERVSVTHGLAPGGHLLCRACRRPISAKDRDRPEFENGVSCHLCRDEFTEARRARFRERQQQITLARARGGRHLGADSAARVA